MTTIPEAAITAETEYLRDAVEGSKNCRKKQLIGSSAMIRVRHDGSCFQVECGWVVPEGHDDDPSSCMDQPFGAVAAWAGRRYAVSDDEQAARCLAALRQTLMQRGTPPGGEKIGSVAR